MLSVVYALLGALNMHSLYKMLKSHDRLQKLLIEQGYQLPRKDRILHWAVVSFCAATAALMFTIAIRSF